MAKKAPKSGLKKVNKNKASQTIVHRQTKISASTSQVQDQLSMR